MILAAWHGLWERKVRTALTLAGVAACVLALTLIDGMLGYMRVDRERDAARYTDQVLMQSPGAGYPTFRSTLLEADVADALTRPDIIPDLSTPILMLVITPADNPMDVAGVIGLGLQPGRERAWLGPVGASAGTDTLAGAGEDAVILGQDAARYYGISSPGATVTVANHPWKVIGILNSTGITRWDRLFIFPILSAQRIFHKEGWISGLLLTARPGQADGVAVSLASAYPMAEIFTQASIRTVLQKELDLPYRFMGPLFWAAFIMAVLMIANIMSIAVRERAQDVEKIRSLGERRIAILNHTLAEAMLLSVGGGLLGIFVAVPAAIAFGVDWIITAGEMLRMGSLVLMAGLLAGIYPAYRAVRAYPQALRLDEMRRQVEKVTAEKQAVDQAYGNLVRGREEERERLARELHDQAIQSLVGLKFRLAEQALQGQVEMQDQVNRIIGTLRELCTDLRPPALDRLGLAASLRSYVNDFAERTGLPVAFHIDGKEQRLSPETELSLFRVAQEALTNAWKHAQAPKVDMQLCFDSSAVRLTICDRGRGFNMPERFGGMVEAGHFGVVGMYERLQLVGGELQLVSQTGEGTTVTATVPFPRR